MKSTFIQNVIIQSSIKAAMSATLIVTMMVVSFLSVEPSVSHGQLRDTSPDFRIRQTITDETSFTTDPVNVTMNGSISGVTGGSATGTTQFVVRSNNASGYYVEIDFFDNAGTNAMRGDESGSDAIVDYAAGTGEPTYNFTNAASAQLAYSVYSSTTLDSDDSFLNNGSSACNQPLGSRTIGKCWKAPSTTNFRIIDRGTAASTGATSTIYFRVHVPSGATPVPAAETYTATATLTLFIQ